MSKIRLVENQVPWWNTEFGPQEIEAVSRAISNRRISQGLLTAEFEEKVAHLLDVNYVIAASNGSVALLMALLSLEIGKGDEVVVPNRTWIATMHAVMMAGATPVLADVRQDRPLLDSSEVERAISERTKAIIPVHLNGRAADLQHFNCLANEHGLVVIEDAAQAMMSRTGGKTLGTIGNVGCFSLSMAKIISTGQGGLLSTNDESIAERLRLTRTHGVENVQDPKSWGEFPGLNFRFTDLQAAIGLVQAEKLPERIEKLKAVYSEYCTGFEDCAAIEVVPVAVETGEIPLYTEILCEDRKLLVEYLKHCGIETRPALPNMNRAKYLKKCADSFPCSDIFEKHGLTLPSGPGQKMEDIRFVIQCIQGFFERKDSTIDSPRER